MEKLRVAFFSIIISISTTHPNCVKMFNTRVLLGTVVGSHVNAVVELPKAFLPRVVGVALVGSYELELARRRMHQWHIVLKHRLVQTFPVEC